MMKSRRKIKAYRRYQSTVDALGYISTVIYTAENFRSHQKIEFGWKGCKKFPLFVAKVEFKPFCKVWIV